jgi:hypothetical protein
MLSAIRRNGDARNNGGTLIYLHIPKAAGTTFSVMLMNRFDRGRILNIREPAQGIEELKRMPSIQREQLQLIQGHFAYGIHEHLAQPYEYITILREPVDRLISHYYFVLRDQTHPLHERVTSQNLGLKEYVLSGLSPELDNGQVRAISGRGRGVPQGACSRELLDQAKDNLQHRFSLVGLAERFDETMLLVSRKFRWRHLYYVRENVTTNRPRTEQFSPEIIEAIKAANSLDMELYAFARELFQSAVRQRGGLFFNFRLARYKARNSTYGEQRKRQKAVTH